MGQLYILNLLGVTVRGLTRGGMLITEFYTAWLQSDKSDLYISNSEIKQRQTRKSSSAK